MTAGILGRLLGEPQREEDESITGYWEKRHAWATAHPVRAAVLRAAFRLRRMPRTVLGWHPVTEIRWAAARLRHGWCPRDVWGLDDFLARVIGESVEHLRVTGHGYPSDMTSEEWDQLLRDMSGPLLAYRTHWDHVDGESPEQHRDREERLMAAAQDALRLVADHLPSLWD